jgi:hypothetical protein
MNTLIKFNNIKKFHKLLTIITESIDNNNHNMIIIDALNDAIFDFLDTSENIVLESVKYLLKDIDDIKYEKYDDSILCDEIDNIIYYNKYPHQLFQLKSFNESIYFY